jgi:hypothetical protein
MAKKNDAPKPEPTDELAEGVQLLEGVTPIATAPILIERATPVVPKKGKLFEERVIEGGHKVKVAKFAVIRPCQSKGKAIKGFQPIYEPRMLAENAGVFSGWRMYMDHVAEEIAEAFAEFLQEKGRSSKELGGRLLKTWYDPELSLESDEENGFRKGGVVGELIPYKIVREMMEEDPFALAVSINAWPTGARIGRPSWDTTKKGAVIEGIRSTPQGSVDFVPRAGAGGGFLTEHATPAQVASAVSLLESAYSASRDADPDDADEERPVKKKLSEMSSEEIAKLTPAQLSEALAEENPTLAESLRESNGGGGTAPVAEGAITKADLDAALSEQRSALIEEFSDSTKSAEEMAEEIVQEREELRELATFAESKIAEVERNGLPGEYANQIRQNYMLTAGGPRAGIVVTEAQLTDAEGKELTAEAVVEARIRADLATSVRLIEAAGGTPRIKGLAPSGKDNTDPSGKTVESKKTLREGSAFTDFLRESGDLTGDNDKDLARVREMVEG